MGFFSRIFGFFSDFFQQVARTIIGQAVEEIKEAALEIVDEIESRHPNLSGEEKWKIAERKLSSRYPSFKSAAINLAIESAVALIKENIDE